MTPAYHELDGENRYGAESMAGDLAEEKVRQFMDSIDRPVQDFGPKRVPTERAQATTWSDKVRHTPDFLGWGRFIEAQGCYSDRILFKVDKLIALEEWAQEMPVWFALYVQKTDEIILAPLETVMWACADERSQLVLLDAGTRGEKYAYEVPIEVLLDVRVADAFAVDRAIREKRKRKK
jgi:hypothetical protein